MCVKGNTKFVWTVLDGLVREAACKGGSPSIPPLYAVTGVLATLHQFLPDINKNVVDRVPDYVSTTPSAQDTNQQSASTTPM